MLGISGWEWVIIGLVVLLVFGGTKQLPELAKSLGKAFKEFKKSVKEVQSDVLKDDDDDSRKPHADTPAQ